MTTETNEPHAVDKQKAENFRRIGNARLSKVLDAIENLEPLTNRNAYHYTNEQVELIFRVIDEALDDLKEAFDNGGPLPKARDLL